MIGIPSEPILVESPRIQKLKRFNSAEEKFLDSLAKNEDHKIFKKFLFNDFSAPNQKITMLFRSQHNNQETKRKQES